MSNHQHLIHIYNKFLSNAATKAELEELFALLNSGTEQELKQLLTNGLEQEVQPDAITGHDVLLQNVRNRIMQQVVRRDEPPVVQLRPRRNRLWYYAAASVLLLAGMAALFIPNKKQLTHHTTDLRPGGNLALLAVGGTDTLNLQTAKAGSVLKKTAGVVINKMGNGTITYTAYGTDTPALMQTNTLIAPRGGQYHVQLSDGTMVVLNSESKLQFSVGFTGYERRVVLTGEAYFEVAKNKHKPFIVTTAGQDVQVLGTKFNISNYAEDGGPVTTLTEGSVKVSANHSVTYLKPGQQSRITAAGIAVSSVDAGVYSAWKNGDFVFENEPINLIMHKLSRWYNFDIDYSKLPQKSLYMKISRQVNLSEVLDMITTTSGIKFRIDEGRVMVM